MAQDCLCLGPEALVEAVDGHDQRGWLRIVHHSIFYHLVTDSLFTSFKGRRHGLIVKLIKCLGRSRCELGDRCDNPTQRARFGVVPTPLGWDGSLLVLLRVSSVRIMHALDGGPTATASLSGAV